MSGVVEYLRIAPSEPLPDIMAYAPCRVVIVDEAGTDGAWRNRVGDWLVSSGCLYMMAWGHDCSGWDDAVDWAMIALYPDGASEADFVMTTWHEQDTLDEVFWFAQFCANHPTLEFAATLILHVADRPERDAMLLRFNAAAESD